MRRISRKTSQRGLFATLHHIRMHTEIVGLILRDLRPLIIVVLVGVGLFFNAGEALRQLATLLER